MNANEPIRVLVIDDHPMLREGIATLLATEPGLQLVAEAANGREGVELFRLVRPDVTLMDLQMPVMNGHDAILAIREEFPDACIVVLTTYSGDERAAKAFRAGASGYLLKENVRKELADTIRRVYAGEKSIPTEPVNEYYPENANDRPAGSFQPEPSADRRPNIFSRLRAIDRPYH